MRFFPTNSSFTSLIGVSRNIENFDLLNFKSEFNDFPKKKLLKNEFALNLENLNDPFDDPTTLENNGDLS